MPLRQFRSVLLALSPLLAVGIIAVALALRVSSERIAELPAAGAGPAVHHATGA
jgi:hypothetical protein